MTTSPHGNILIRIPGPQGAATPGMTISVQFRMAIANYTPTLGSVLVRVPGTLASFQTQGGPLFLFDAPRNVTLSGPGFSDPSLTLASQVITNDSTFVPGEIATFGTQLAAIMTPLPYGAVNLSVEWEWTLTSQDGSSVTSSWQPTPPQSVLPAQVATLVSVSPTQFTAGSTIGVCLTGPIINRTISVHAESVNPVNDFVQNTSLVPPGTVLPACWTLLIPTGLPVQPLLVHVWDYNAVTLLLFIVKVFVVNSTALIGAPFTLPWTTAVNAGAVVVVIGIALWAVTVRSQGGPDEGDLDPPTPTDDP